MGTDEEGTLTQLKGHRQALVDPKIQEHRGRIARNDVETACWSSLRPWLMRYDALLSAARYDRAERQGQCHKRIEFRVGINLGDIIIDDDDIYGDGVNVAVRLKYRRTGRNLHYAPST